MGNKFWKQVDQCIEPVVTFWCVAVGTVLAAAVIACMTYGPYLLWQWWTWAPSVDGYGTRPDGGHPAIVFGVIFWLIALGVVLPIFACAWWKTRRRAR